MNVSRESATHHHFRRNFGREKMVHKAKNQMAVHTAPMANLSILPMMLSPSPKPRHAPASPAAPDHATAVKRLILGAWIAHELWSGR